MTDPQAMERRDSTPHATMARQIDDLMALRVAADMRSAAQRVADEKRLIAMEINLRVNTAATDRIDKATAGLVSVFNTLESGLKVMGWIGDLGKKVLQIGALVGGGYAMWIAFKTWILQR